MKYPVIVFSCDQWKSHDSMRCKGVFTSLTQLRKGLNRLLEEEVIEYEEGYTKDISQCFSFADFNDNFQFLYLEEITLNEVR